MLGVPQEIMGDALTYVNVYYCGIIASMIYNVGTGHFCGPSATAACPCMC